MDSPSWNLVRIAKLAARVYAPLGTRMSLGDYVRVERAFLEAFKTSGFLAEEQEKPHSQTELVELYQSLVVGLSFPFTPDIFICILDIP